MQLSKLSALTNPIRLQILGCLGNAEHNVKELQNICGLSQSALSQHLAKLREAHLVETVRKGKYVYYKVINEKVTHIAKELLQLVNSNN